jgi:uncharacterized FAD-dependent dehydrogenase
MQKELEFIISPDKLNDKAFQRNLIAGELGITPNEITAVRILRRSIDARRKDPVYLIRAIAYLGEEPDELLQPVELKPVNTDKKAIIIGFGPAGMFAALGMIEKGVKPIVFERGKSVRERKNDIDALEESGIVDVNSNYCFGEGGAGTFSDGKLYTRSTKRGNLAKIANILVQHGASSDILIDAHPHIGSDKLPEIVSNIRETIIKCGGEVHFESKVTDLNISDGKVKGVVVNNHKEIDADAVILAAGHSAHDIYEMLQNKNIYMEAKAFALGVRIEHPQSMIDKMQYHKKVRPDNLPAAAYNLKAKVNGKGVYSFCMCPGGYVIPAVTGEDELVLNGMSESDRNSKYANSGVVVTVGPEDWGEYAEYGALAALMYQKSIEKNAYISGGSNLKAPAQRLKDYVNKRISANFPETSYRRGIVSSDISAVIPHNISETLRLGLIEFGKKRQGYIVNDAIIMAAETRTSSPVRITRSFETFMHVDVGGLFPCGEGAGYAGGIMSSALDGQRCAAALCEYITGESK